MAAIFFSFKARKGGRLNYFYALDIVAKPTLFSRRDAQVALAMFAPVEDYTYLLPLEN